MIGRVEIVQGLVFACEEPGTQEAADWFSRASAASIAMPYLREAVATTAQRVGLVGVTMPLFVSGPSRPASSSPTADALPVQIPVVRVGWPCVAEVVASAGQAQQAGHLAEAAERPAP